METSEPRRDLEFGEGLQHVPRDRRGQIAECLHHMDDGTSTTDAHDVLFGLVAASDRGVTCCRLRTLD